MKKLEDDQKKFMRDHGFESFLSLSDFKVHVRLVEWVMQKIIRIFVSIDTVVIVFDKLLTQQILGLRDGNTPVKLSGSNEAVKEIKSFYHGHLNNNRLGTGACEKLLLLLHKKEKFIRTFMIYLFGTILCPATRNYVNMDYFHSLVDISKLIDYDWSTHVVSSLMREVKKYQSFSRNQREIAYMYHLEMPTTGLKLRNMQYNTPRICHVTNGDFEYAAFVDRSRMSLSYVTYGSRSFCPRDQIPYLNQSNADAKGIKADVPEVAGAEDVGDVGGDDIGIGDVALGSTSLDEWIRMSASSSQGTQKHNIKWRKETESTLDVFKKCMMDLHTKRTGKMISEISNALHARDAVAGNGNVDANPTNTTHDDAPQDVAFEALSKDTSGGTDNVRSSPSSLGFIMARRSGSLDTTSILKDGWIPCFTQVFRNAMKARDEMNNEVMACWIEMFNEECREESKMQSNIKKICVLSFLNVC
uniref:Aminotransferase-like plant mobile domain-containing protein n=1 Tax=Oryza punctata TaxID=4537 RepID=A0A0E0LTN2_ORYPU